MTMPRRFPVCPCCDATAFSRLQGGADAPAPADWRDFFYGGRNLLGPVFRCRSCGFHFRDHLTAEADALYAAAPPQDYFALEDQRLAYFAKIRARLARIPEPGTRLLDFGSASGAWLYQWPGAAHRVGIEINPAFRQIAAERGIETLSTPPPGMRFDIVSAFDFVEHLPDPRGFLQSLESLCAPGATIILGVPDMGKWLARLLGLRYYLYCPMHYNYFTATALEALIRRALPSAAIRIAPSPKMYATFGGAAKWLPGPQLPRALRRLPLPAGYAASLIAVIGVGEGVGA